MRKPGKSVGLTARVGATKPVESMSETQLQKSIVDALNQAGYWAFRVNSGTRSNGTVKLAPKGTPDICLVSPPGWLEVKLPGKELSEDQKTWHARARRLGVRVATVTGTMESLVWAGDWTSADAKRVGLALDLKKLAEEMSDG